MTDTSSAPLREALETLRDNIDALIDASGGVFGLHLNGDASPWSELARGGYFSSWLGEALEQADAALSSNALRPVHEPKSPEVEGLPSGVRARGVGRVADEPRALLVLLTDMPSDDDIRALHDTLTGGR